MSSTASDPASAQTIVLIHGMWMTPLSWRTAVPIHYEGWKHFQQGREGIEQELARAPEEIRERFRWLPVGVGVEIAA
jgi:hypothetical protein